MRLLPIMAALLGAAGTHAATAQSTAPRFTVSFPASVRTEPVTGRVFVFVTTDSAPEPRFQSGGLSSTAPFFGRDVSGLAPSAMVIVDASAPGFPLHGLAELPEGDYYVQAVVNVYTQFHRADGHTIWAHMDQWEGQQFASSPGNLVSAVRRVHVAPGATIPLELTRVIPPVVVPEDTRWIKHVKIQSTLLTKFWGRPMYLGAVVLLPAGYDEHPDVRYPVDYEQDHFSLAPPYHFQTTAPVPVTEREAGARAWVINLRRGEGYKLYQDWSSADFPRMLMVTFLHPTPYYDDSYAVNSANNGPYGDAIMTELIPYIESHFRIVREPYARVLSGGSTGGWESLALQAYHPDFFGGAWVYYPDPVDFHRWVTSDVYAEDDAYLAPGTRWLPHERPFMRTPEGQPMLTMRQVDQLENTLGTHGRSAEQQQAWEAVYGPVGEDGYPTPLWNHGTGTIDHAVAAYMRDHGYDLTAYIHDHWPQIGSRLAGRLHVYTGDMDHFYLNLAVYRLQEMLDALRDPPYGGSFTYGRPIKGHGIRPTTTGDMLRAMAVEIARNAPGGAADGWHYPVPVTVP
ncbi:MAG TPA: alpha/beta hydrolase-fold protein [Gemmatimonadaceae bacterium]